MNSKSYLLACSNFYPYAFGGTEIYVANYCEFLNEHGIKPIVICAVPEVAFTEHANVYEDDTLKACTYQYNGITVFGLIQKLTSTEMVYAKTNESFKTSCLRFINAHTILKNINSLHIQSFTSTIGLDLFESVLQENKSVKVITSYHTPISCPKGTLIFGDTLNECNITPNLVTCTSCIIESQKKIPVNLAKLVNALNLKHNNLPAIFRQKRLTALDLGAFEHLKAITNEWWCYSIGIKNILMKNGINHANIKMVRHGIAKMFLSTTAPKQLNQTIFMYSGRQVKIKGIDTLLKAWLQLPVKENRLLWLTFQPFSTNSDNNDLFKKAVSRKDIIFLGEKNQSELISLYKKAHFVIIPSECFEIGPLVFHEAIASGCNVITSDIGGCKELALHYDDSTTIFKAGDVKGLAQIILSSKYRNSTRMPQTSSAHFKSISG